MNYKVEYYALCSSIYEERVRFLSVIESFLIQVFLNKKVNINSYSDRVQLGGNTFDDGDEWIYDWNVSDSGNVNITLYVSPDGFCNHVKIVFYYSGEEKDCELIQNKIEELITQLKSRSIILNEGSYTPPSTKEKSGCYIATAVYGSYDCPEVWTLRRYRDNILAESWNGRLFIKIYYAISPTVVRYFGNKKIFQRFWKAKLDQKVNKLNKKGILNTPYSDYSI